MWLGEEGPHQWSLSESGETFLFFPSSSSSSSPSQSMHSLFVFFTMPGHGAVAVEEVTIALRD